MPADIVLFRRFRDGDVIALFPYLPAEGLSAWPCQSYMRIGQHGAADPRIVHDTRPARWREYAGLKAELERLGYRLAVRRRFPSDAHARRKAVLPAQAPPCLGPLIDKDNP
jgi:hypothetical protein